VKIYLKTGSIQILQKNGVVSRDSGSVPGVRLEFGQLDVRLHLARPLPVFGQVRLLCRPMAIIGRAGEASVVVAVQPVRPVHFRWTPSDGRPLGSGTVDGTLRKIEVEEIYNGMATLIKVYKYIDHNSR